MDASTRKTSCSEEEECNLRITESADHSCCSTKTNNLGPNCVQTVTLPNNKTILHSPVVAVKQHYADPRFLPLQDSPASSIAGSATTEGTSEGSHSSNSKSGSSSSYKPQSSCSNAPNKGTQCSSSASSSTEEAEAREKRFGSVNLHPLPSVALTAIMNQAMRRSLYTESSVQNPEQLPYAVLLTTHKNYGSSSGHDDLKMNSTHVPTSNNDLSSLLSHTSAQTNLNSVHSTSVDVCSSQFNQNLPLHLIPPNLWPQLICPIHADNFLAQFSQILCKTNNEINETNNDKTISTNFPILCTKNEQSLGNMTSSTTLEEMKPDYNNNMNNLKKATHTIITTTVPETNTYSGIPVVGYSCNVSGPNNNNNNNNNNSAVQPTSQQRVGPYYLGPTLGRGNFAVVKLGKHSQLSVKVAIKIMNKDLIGSKNLSKISRELEAMKRCQHPHIIRLYHVMETESSIFMVTEYASKGEVFDHISLSHAFGEKEARELFWQIVCAIEFCHASGIVHRDLKAENLLLDADFKIKVADFGFCNFFQNGQLLSTHCGSPQYAAPELFKGESYDGTLADVWSLGVILYILVCGSFPFPGESLGEIRTQVLRGLVRFPFYLSTSCEQVIRSMLQVDPVRRFKLKQVMTTAWMQESPNVEHYKSLMNKYRIQAKEHQFEILFHQQHPEHSKIAKEEFLERIERKLDSGIVKALSNETGLDEEQIRQSTIQRKYDRYHAAYELLKEKIKIFYQNPILRKFVNDEMKKQQTNTFHKLDFIQQSTWQPMSEEHINTMPTTSTTTSTTPTTTQLGILDETMLSDEQTTTPPPLPAPPSSDMIMSSDSSDVSDVPMKETCSSCSPSSCLPSCTINNVQSTTSTITNPSNCEKSENPNSYYNQQKDFNESNLKEWKCVTQPKNTELNAAMCILKADEDEILSRFGIQSGPINKSFSNSTRRHTLQYTTSLFRKHDHPDTTILTSPDNNNNNDGDIDVNNRQSDTSTTTTTTTNTTNNDNNNNNIAVTNSNVKVDSHNNNNNSKTNENSNIVKRTTVRRFPRQITQPHSNRLQYNQNNAENSDQMLLTRLDWMPPNTWETSFSDYRKSHLLKSSRPYLNKISKQNEQTLTSLELGQEASTTRLPNNPGDTTITTTSDVDDDDDEEGVVGQDDVSILIDQENIILPDEMSQSIQLTENISSMNDYNNVTTLDRQDTVSEKSSVFLLTTECPNPVESPLEMVTLEDQQIPSAQQNSVDMMMNTESTTEKIDNVTRIMIEKSSLHEDPCWSNVRISGGMMDEDEDDNSCNPTAGVLRTLLPQLNLPANLPAMIHQPVAYFTVKDPNLLAPPEFMTPHSSSFPRRSSDGAADLQPLHRPVITVGGSYPEQANYRKENSGTESENSSLAVINNVHSSKLDPIEGTTVSVTSTNLSDRIHKSRQKYNDYEQSKHMPSSSHHQQQHPQHQQQQLPEFHNRSSSVAQHSTYHHSQRNRLPLGIWWKLTSKKFNQPSDFKSESWDAQFARHQKRFSLPVNSVPVRQPPSGSVKTELQCKCHQPLTSELLQEIQQKLQDTSWIEKLTATGITHVQCTTDENKFNFEQIPEMYRRGSEASQMSAWEYRLRQYNELYDPAEHPRTTSSFHQPVPELEPDEEEEEEGERGDGRRVGQEEEKLNSNYPFFTFSYNNDNFVTNTRVTTTTTTTTEYRNIVSPVNQTIDTSAITTTSTCTSQCVPYESSSVKDDHRLNTLSNESYDSNTIPISQSDIELTDLKTELHKLEVEQKTSHSSFTDDPLHFSSIESSKSIIDDNHQIDKFTGTTTHLPTFNWSTGQPTNITSFLSDYAINHMQQFTSLSTTKSTLTTNEPFSTTSPTSNPTQCSDDKQFKHRRASSVIVNNHYPIGLNYSMPPDQQQQQLLYETSKASRRKHRHSVGEMLLHDNNINDNNNNTMKSNYEYCSDVSSDVFNVSSEFQQPAIQLGLNVNMENVNTQLDDEMSIKSLSSFSMITTPSPSPTSVNTTNNNNTGIGQRLFDRLHPDRANYLHVLQHSGGSLDRRLSPDLLKSPRKKIYQEWLPKLTELSHKAFDVARDKMNKVKSANNPQSLVYNLIHHPSTHYYTTSNILHQDEQYSSDIIHRSPIDHQLVVIDEQHQIQSDNKSNPTATTTTTTNTTDTTTPSSISSILHEKDEQINVVTVNVNTDPDIDQDIDEDYADEKDCALAPLQTHLLNTTNSSIHHYHHTSRPRHRIMMNQNIGQNLSHYPQQVMPFFHGSLLHPTNISQHQHQQQQQQSQNAFNSQLPYGTSSSSSGFNNYTLQDLVDFSNPQALPAAAAAASLLLFRSTDDDEDLAAIDRVNQRLALNRLITSNLIETNQLVNNNFPNLHNSTISSDCSTSSSSSPQTQTMLPPPTQQQQQQPIRSFFAYNTNNTNSTFHNNQ
ncbi:unnamed protein product [Schistosoma turkestanicum]|nr:unnamed protein product [Schistosoma turkestanicum]